MATRLIEQEDVSKACNDLIRAGEEPSTIKVRKILGKGSHSTIQKFIKTWKESEDGKAVQVDLLPAVVDLPPEFKEGADIFIKQIFKLAEDQHMAVAEQIKQSCDQAVAVAHAEVREAVDYVETVDQENADLKESLESLVSKKDGLVKDKADLEKKVTGLTYEVQDYRKEVSRKQKGIDDLKISLKDADGQIILKTNQWNEAKSNITGLEKEKEIMAKDAKTQAKAFDQAQNSAAELKSDLKIALASAKSQATADAKAITDHQKELSGAQTKLQAAIDALTTERVAAADQVGQLKGQLTAMENRLVNQTRLQEEIVSLKAEVKTGTDENNGQAEQIVDLQKTIAELKKAGVKKKK